MSLVPNFYSFLALVFVKLYEKFMIDGFSKLWQGLEEHYRFQLWFGAILDFILYEYYYKFKSKFNTELTLMYGQKGP